MKANFKDPETGELIFVQSFKTSIDPQLGAVYFANDAPLINDKGVSLQLIPFNQRSEEADRTIIGNERLGQLQSSYEKDVAFLKKRTKAHAKSDEGLHLKSEAIKREYKTMGLTPK